MQGGGLNICFAGSWSLGAGFLLPKESKASSPSLGGMSRAFVGDLTHHMSLFYPPALQERYGKEAGRSPAASEGEGDPPGGPASPVLPPMPLAEVELKWAMEKEEKRLLWEQLQGLEVNLGLSGPRVPGHRQMPWLCLRSHGDV